MEARKFAEQGYTIVLIGHQGHEEVEGTTGEAPDNIILVETVADVDALELDDPDHVAFITQTTLSVDETAEIIARLRERFPAITSPKSDDICYATTNRQIAVKQLARECELVLVIGSTNSSNSNRLVEVAREHGAALAPDRQRHPGRRRLARRRRDGRDHLGGERARGARRRAGRVLSRARRRAMSRSCGRSTRTCASCSRRRSGPSSPRAPSGPARPGTVRAMHGPSGHDHGHAVDLDRSGSKRALALVLCLTTAFLLAEVVGGLISGSLALLADAGHMLSDSISLGVALFAAWLAGRPSGPSRTFGFRRAEILAALFNGVTLVAISIWVFVEAGVRFGDPPDVEAGLMLAIAIGGLVINLVAARILYAHSGESLNVSAAMRHVLADLLGSIGVIVAAVVILATGWEYADPVASVVIGLLILASSWTILRDSVQILLEGSPPGTDVEQVGRAMAATVGVREVHDLHVWTITSGFPALAAHVLVARDTDCHATRRDLERMLHERFGLDHTTPPGRSRGRRAAADRDRARRLREPGMRLERDGYELDDDRDRIDVDAVWAFLRDAYWSPGVPRDVVQRAISGSLCIALYAPDGSLAGFGRAVTDSATYAWIADVFVLPEHRGRGLGVWLVESLLAHPRLQGLRATVLATRDAHSLYERFGFSREGEHGMARRAPVAELYGSPGEKATE